MGKPVEILLLPDFEETMQKQLPTILKEQVEADGKAIGPK